MMNNWFESRGLRVLGYQTDTIQKVKDSLINQEITVLAACPSAGKTIMTIHCIEDYLNNNPGHKVIVLAHGTTILRTQFHDVLDEVKPGFTYKLVENFNEYNEFKDIGRIFIMY
jgi:ERCC4-related helicase